jgi:Tol biopolymer transport system component
MVRISATVIATNGVLADRPVRQYFTSMAGGCASVEEMEGGKILLRSHIFNGKTSSVIIAAANLPKNARGELSLDGGRLCFVEELGRQDTIKVVSLDNGLVEDVFVVRGKVSPPAWSPDGTSIAYYFAESPDVMHDGYRIGVSRKTGGTWGHQAITPPSEPAERTCLRHFAPTWSSDGSVIVFEGRYEESEDGPQTYMVRVGEQQVTRVGGYPAGASPAPGGVVYAEMAADAAQNGSFDTAIWLLNTATGKSRKISQKKLTAFPRLSPDMQWLAYSDSSGSVYVTALSNSTPRKVVDTGSGVAVSTFYWLPPGTDTNPKRENDKGKP